MRKIIIPTDFSENAINAIRYAVELFKYEKSEFFILHAFADEVYDKNASMERALFEKIKTQTRKEKTQQLADVQTAIQNISPNPIHKYHMLPLFGTLIDETNDLVDRENVDVVVMGTKGQTNDRNLTFGSNTLQVLKYVKCPVMVIPEMYSYQQPNKVLFPTNYLLPYKRRELKLFSSIAWSFRSEVNFLYNADFEKLSFRQEDNKLFLEGALPGIKLVFHHAKEHNLANTIHEFVKEHDINMLVMVNSRQSYLENSLHSTVIDRIGLQIKIPFLVLQNLQRY